MRISSVLGLAIAVVVAACGGDDDPVADDAPSFLALIPVANCQHLVDCGRYRSVDGCLAAEAGSGDETTDWTWRSLFVHQYDQRWLAAVERGAVAFDRDQANACLDRLRGGSCSVGVDHDIDIDACDAALRGIVAIGEPSRFPFECASGEWQPGVDCDVQTSCCAVACGPRTTLPVPREMGQPCSGTICERGLACRDDLCVPGPTAGEACITDLECPSRHRCADEVCVRGDVSFETCLSGGDGLCSEYSEACAAGECRTRGGRGATCGEARRCQRDLVCDDGRCLEPAVVEPGAVGDPCNLDSCGEGLFCNPDGAGTPVCQPVRASGATCSADRECLSAHCGWGICAAPVVCP